MEDYLYQKDLCHPFPAVKPKKLMEEEWAMLDRKALA